MTRAIHLALFSIATAACRLGPLVDDEAGASANLLPATATVPLVASNADLVNQITLNDGLDTTDGVVARGSGFSAGNPVGFWAFGPTSRAPAPMYIFGTGDALTGFQPNQHLPLVMTVPGDADYNPVHTIYRVVVTEKYAGELITTQGALDDAIEIGLVHEPVAIDKFVNQPIVPPGVTLEVGGTAGKAAPTKVYARGFLADSFQLGGDFPIQPNPNGLLPTSQVSFVRHPKQATYDATKPVFQLQIPAAPPQMAPNYTPISFVINVDVNSDVEVTSDAQLFTRSATGAIIGTTDLVLLYTVTAQTLDLQLQFKEGSP